MAFYNKIGLLVLNDKGNKFLVCQKYAQNVTAEYIMPGGQFDEPTVEECLTNEVEEELSCKVDVASLEFVGEYIDVAAGRPGRDVSIQLYSGRLIGEPQPSTEVQYLHWIGAEDAKSNRVSPIVRNKIIPDLIQRGILKQ